MALSDYKVSSTDISQNAIQYAVASDRLTGTVLENKQVFDAFPSIIAQRHNELIDEYLAQSFPEGDCGLDYTSTEINYIATVLGCSEADITL